MAASPRHKTTSWRFSLFCKFLFTKKHITCYLNLAFIFIKPEGENRKGNINT